MLVFIFVERMLRIHTVHAEVAEGGPEEVVLGTVLQQVGLEGRRSNLGWKLSDVLLALIQAYLLIDLYSLVIIL